MEFVISANCLGIMPEIALLRDLFFNPLQQTIWTLLDHLLGDVDEEGHLEMALLEVSLFPQEGEEEGVEETELLCCKLEMKIVCFEGTLLKCLYFLPTLFHMAMHYTSPFFCVVA